MPRRSRPLWEHEQDLRAAMTRLVAVLDDPHAAFQAIDRGVSDVRNEAAALRNRLAVSSPRDRHWPPAWRWRRDGPTR